MNFLSFSLAITSIAFTPADLSAEEILPGTYSNGGSYLIVEHGLVGLTLREVGCLGELDGHLAQNYDGDWFILGSKQPQCVLSVKIDGPFSLIVEQHENCSYYHGASCGFSGYYRRSN